MRRPFAADGDEPTPGFKNPLGTWAVVRALSALALAVLLAGCSSAPGPPPEAEPAPTAIRLPIDARLPLNWGGECMGICVETTDRHDMPRLALARDEAAVALAVTLDSDEALPPGARVVLRAECEDAVGPACPVLGEAAGPLPLRLDVGSAAVPAGATLLFSAYLVGGDAHVPVASAAVIESQDEWVAETLWARLAGEVQALRGPAAPLPVAAQEARAIEGDLSCNPADLNQPPYTSCTTYARPWYTIGDLGAPASRVRLELEWTANRETARELVLALSCGQGDIYSDQGCPGLPAAEVSGPSPLVLEAVGWAPADAEFRVDVHTRQAVDTRLTSTVAESLPQPYRLLFEATVLRDPAPEGGGRTSHG